MVIKVIYNIHYFNNFLLIDFNLKLKYNIFKAKLIDFLNYFLNYIFFF